MNGSQIHYVCSMYDHIKKCSAADDPSSFFRMMVATKETKRDKEWAKKFDAIHIFQHNKKKQMKNESNLCELFLFHRFGFTAHHACIRRSCREIKEKKK